MVMAVLAVMTSNVWGVEAALVPLSLSEGQESKSLTLRSGDHALQLVLVELDESGTALQEPFYISATECPQWVWNAISPKPPYPKGYQVTDPQYKPNQPEGSLFPVNNVNAAYVDSFFLGLSQRIEGFRLPYEFEWRFAARRLDANKDIEVERRRVGKTITDQPGPSQVGGQSSGAILFDMFSNVEEMCMPDSATGISWPTKYIRVGGAWNSSSNEIGIGYRLITSGNGFMPTCGFRLVVSRSVIKNIR
jgi:formylglycine-generating enzyme required for sulfatase activity